MGNRRLYIRTTNSLSRAISTATSTSARRHKVNKKSIQFSMPWILYILQFRCVYSRCFEIRFVFCIPCSFVCKYFLTPHDTCFFFSLYSYLDKTDKRTDLCMINRLKKKNNRLITDYVFSLFCFFFCFRTLKKPFFFLKKKKKKKKK